ncbi:unnamed protein product [Heligmosomoides polygyrus]|uniref:Protein CUSTOS n=1 Tax=Heligmosomoides polygyrus TaxID=6339 RepID=A0A3P7Z299_HELPZ|nr:unnamed protein product [Heligmosomoides polygyrus]
MKHRNVERVLPPDSDDAVKASIDQEKLCDGISTQTSAVEQSGGNQISSFGYFAVGVLQKPGLRKTSLKFFRDIFVKSALPFAKLVEKLEEVRREYAQQGESSSESDDDENVNEKIAGEVRIMVPVLPVLVQPYHGGASVKKVPMHRRKVRKGLSTYRYRAKPKKIKSKAASDDEEDSDDADVVVKQVFPTLGVPVNDVSDRTHHLTRKGYQLKVTETPRSNNAEWKGVDGPCGSAAARDAAVLDVCRLVACVYAFVADVFNGDDT